jgi:chemosensory pili system protein ChpC
VIGGRTRIVIFSCLGQKLPAGHFGIATQGFPQLVRVNPHVIAADNSRAFPERSPVLCQVRMVNELPLIPDLERLEEMISDETTVTAA